MIFKQLSNPNSVIESIRQYETVSATVQDNEKFKATISFTENLILYKSYSLSFSVVPYRSIYNSWTTLDAAHSWDKKINVKLQNDNNSQLLSQINVIKNDSEKQDALSFTIDFIPFDEYSKIIFEFDDEEYQAKFDITSIQMSYISNLLDGIDEDDIIVRKIGVHGSPNAKFMLNMDQIHLGYSGFYETTANINNIYYLGIPINENGIRIIDILYQTN